MPPAVAPKAPTNELGADQYSSQWSPPVLDDNELHAAWRWPTSVQETVPAMLNDAQVEGMYRAVMLAVRGYDWFLKPNGARDEIVARISTDYNLPVGPGREINQARARQRFIFDEHLEDALRAPAYGAYFFEQVYDVRQDGDPSLNAGWVAHLRKLAPRVPKSIIDIQPAPDNGLEFIRVPTNRPARTGGPVSIGTVDIPVGRLAAYVWDREGGNWAGRSMLRSLHLPWARKYEVLKAGVTTIQRAGGVPYVEAPEGASPTQMRELHALAAAFRIGETAGAALPYGAQLKFASAAGGDQAINYAKFQNEEMARAWVQMLMVLGQTDTGSRALGETFSDTAELVPTAVATWFCNVFNRHVIEDDVEWNEGPAERYAPLLAFRPRPGLQNQLATTLEQAQSAGALPADSAAAALVKGERRGRRRPTRAASAATQQPAFQAADLQAAHDEQLAAMVAAFAQARAEQIQDLKAQITTATTVSALATITPAVAGVDALATAMVDLLQGGSQTAVQEAAAQGHTLPAPDLAAATAQAEAAAEATATLIAARLGQSAASKAVALAGEGAAMSDVADEVAQHLADLAGQDAEYELTGALTRAQNEGRFAAMQAAPADTVFEASDLNDTNTCEPCRLEDGTQYETLAAARLDFPAGQFLGCLGGNRCRCAVVAIYPEAEGQA